MTRASPDLEAMTDEQLADAIRTMDDAELVLLAAAITHELRERAGQCDAAANDCGDAADTLMEHLRVKPEGGE